MEQSPSENQELKHWRLPPLLFAPYVWFFLWVPLFPFTLYGFSFSAGDHGLWQHLSFISYNFIKERWVGRRRLILFLEARSKNSRDWLDLNSQLSWTNQLWPLEEVMSYQPRPRAHHCVCRWGMFLQKGNHCDLGSYAQSC